MNRLYAHDTGAFLREATDEETERSADEALRDNGRGLIEVDGKLCFVIEGDEE